MALPAFFTILEGKMKTMNARSLSRVASLFNFLMQYQAVQSKGSALFLY